MLDFYNRFSIFKKKMIAKLEQKKARLSVLTHFFKQQKTHL